MSPGSLGGDLGPGRLAGGLPREEALALFDEVQLGLMDLRGLPDPFSFVLRRER